MDWAVERGSADGLWEDWARLHAASATATPFTSPGWARAWWPHFGRDADPFTVVVRDGAGAVCGLAPLALRRRGPLRVLEPVGMEPGDYWDVLAEPPRRAAVAAAVAQALRAHRRDWDAWVLRCLPPDSPLERALAPAGLRSLIRPRIASPAIALPASFDDYLRSLSSSHRQNLRRHLRRLDRGEVQLERVGDVSVLPEAIERWQSFRAGQWDAAGREINPEHLSERFAAFVLDVLRELLPAGSGLLWRFRVDGEVVGSYVNFADAHAFHWYLGGFDPAVMRLGLGKIAIGQGIRESIEAGRALYDFGRGAEPYKYWYGARARPLAARVVAGGSPRSLASLLAARAAIEWRARISRR